MAISLKLAREKYGFEPKFSFAHADYVLSITSNKNLENSKLHALFRKLIKTAQPSYEDEFDSYWDYFYLPLRRSGKLITVPFRISMYQSNFFMYFHHFNGFEVHKGSNYVDDFLFEMFDDVLKFIPLFKKHGRPFIEKTVPYDIRVGKIKGKYIMDKVMTKDKTSRDV